MWDKIKTFYTEHKVYVNIGIGLVVALVGWRLLRKKQ